MQAADSSVADVNGHYLDRIVALSDSQPVEAADDIYSQNGIKLVAKGARIHAADRDRLLVHKLKKPLENSIALAESVNTARLQQIARDAFARLRGLEKMLSLEEAETALASVDPGVTSWNMLTLLSNEQHNELEHCVLSAIFSWAIGKKMALPADQLKQLLLAGLMHDVGKLYIDPQRLGKNRGITPLDWPFISVHPVVGHKIMLEICKHPRNVAQAVLDHHERYDGGGYPRAIAGDAISLGGQILAAADMMASLAESANNPFLHSALAIRIVPGEHSRRVQNVICQVFDKIEAEHDPDGLHFSDECIHALLLQVGRAAEELQNHFHEREQRSAEFALLLTRAIERFRHVQRAFSSSGLDLPELLGKDGGIPEHVRLDADLILRELRWRFRDLARDLALRSSLLPASEILLLQPMIDILHDDLPQ